jgi:hypothetical protein
MSSGPVTNLRVKRVFGFRTVVHPIAIPSALDEFQSDQFTQFLPKGAIIQTGTAFDFTDMEFFSRSAKKEPEYLRTRSR